VTVLASAAENFNERLLFQFRHQIFFLRRVGIFSQFCLCCFYFLLKVHIKFFISTFVVSNCYSSFVYVTFRSFRNIQRATRISVCVTTVCNSHNFFVESSLTILFFFDNDAYAFASTRHNFFHDDARDSTSTTSRCFSTTSDTTACRFVAATWYRFFPRLALVLNYIPRPLCLSKVTFPPMSPCRICRLIKYVCHHGVLVSDVYRVERFRLTLRLFDDVSTTSWFTFSIPTWNFSMTRRNFQSVLSVLFLFFIKSLC